jgi:SAM-dependent methyltransferase
LGTIGLASPFRTFRDPAGSVEIKLDGVYRQVRPPYEDEILTFLGSTLSADLVAQGRLVASEVVLSSAQGQPLLLRHPRISFPSYGWEWPPVMWLAAAELTLELCRDLMKNGWILKDATPLNILFRGMRPIFVDLLSIRKAELDQPIWYAYGQFVRTFLLPMPAYSKLGWPLQATLLRRDGYEPEEIFAALSWHTRLRQPARSAVTLPLMLTRLVKTCSAGLTRRFAKDPEVTKHIILKTLGGLLHHIRGVTPPAQASRWSVYTQTAGHYSSDDHADKRDFVIQALKASNPECVLDVGCNTGVYSALAADAGAEVVAIDTDIQAVNCLFTSLSNTGKNILPLCVDLAHPTPATGWENRENPSFLDRCHGHFDTVMMLAVLHHLLLRGQIPLDRIALLCKAITTRNLILEWVPPADAKFQELLRGRDETYAHITESTFREAFAEHFVCVRERTLSNHRVLLHFRRK